MSRRLDVAIFLVALLGSLAAHFALIEGLGSAARRAPKKRQRAVEMALVAPPPKVEPPPPPAPKPMDLTKERPKPKIELPPPSNTSEAAPPEPKEPPKPVFGISMSSTVGPGSGSGFTVRVGNTLMKDPEKEYTPPEAVQPYAKPVSLHEVSKMPLPKGECKGPYPPEAKALGIEGTVLLEVEVLADGSVGEVRITKGLGHGLDEAAQAEMKKCRFAPAEMAGKAVPTRIAWKYRFVIED